MIDPLERWREIGLDDKPDYAGLLTYAGLPFTHDPADLAGVDVAIVGAPMDDLTSDRPGTRFGPRAIAVRETPDDFNGLKASLAFVNVDKSCSDASLRPAGRSADLFKAVPVASLQRRSINPVNLSVQLVCANTNVGAPLDLGMLKAGERYSVMLVPSASGPRLLSTTDTLSH